MNESPVSIRGSGLVLGETPTYRLSDLWGMRGAEHDFPRTTIFRLSSPVFASAVEIFFDMSPFGIVMDRNSPSKPRRAAKACEFCRRRKVSQLRRGL